MHPLRLYREQHSLTQDELSKRAHVSRAYLAQIEVGLRGVTDAVLAGKLSAATNGYVTVAELLTEPLEKGAAWGEYQPPVTDSREPPPDVT